MSATSSTEGIDVGLDEYELLLESAVAAALRGQALTGFVTRLVVHRAVVIRRESRTRIAAEIIDFGLGTAATRHEWRAALRALEAASKND